MNSKKELSFIHRIAVGNICWLLHKPTLLLSTCCSSCALADSSLCKLSFSKNSYYLTNKRVLIDVLICGTLDDLLFLYSYS